MNKQRTLHKQNNRVFHKLDEIGNNSNIGIRALLRDFVTEYFSCSKANIGIITNFVYL